MKKPNDDEKLAAKYGCDPRTIRRWRKAGAPFQADAGMMNWLDGQRTIPAGTRALLEADKTQQRISAAAAVQVSNLEQGAPVELRRLAAAAAEAHCRYKAAVSQGNAVEIRSALKIWLIITESLRKFDKDVSEQRRETGEMVPREGVEELLRFVGYWMRMGSRSYDSLAKPLADSSEPIACHAILRRWAEGFESTTIAALNSANFYLSPFPRWMVDAVAKGIGCDTYFQKWQERNQQLTEFMSTFFAAVAKENGEQAVKENAEVVRQRQKDIETAGTFQK